MEKRAGSIIKDNINKVILGEALDVLNNFPDNSVDYTLTSPPYNNKTNRIVNKGKSFYNEYKDKMTNTEYEEFLWHIITKLIRVTKNYTFFNIMYNTDNKEILWKLFGIFNNNIKDVLIWKKPIQPAMYSKCLTHNYEFIWVLSKERENRAYDIDFGRKGEHTTCFEELNNSIQNKERFKCDGNFAIMPVQLVRRLLSTFTREKDLILDPFFGSGTTGVVCQELNRRFIGIEMIPKTAKIAIKRLEMSSSLI